MGALEYTALGFIFTVAMGVAGWVWRVATRIGESEAASKAAANKSEAAALQAAALSIKLDSVTKELAAHREDTAKEYVSYKHMVTLENRLVDAIGSLGNRIDGLFSRLASHP